MKIIFVILKYSGPLLPGNIKSDIDRGILPGILYQSCNKYKKRTDVMFIFAS